MKIKDLDFSEISSRANAVLLKVTSECFKLPKMVLSIFGKIIRRVHQRETLKMVLEVGLRSN
jgi:hypothetical protein